MAPPRKPTRSLSGEERALWRYVTRNDKRLRPEVEIEECSPPPVPVRKAPPLTYPQPPGPTPMTVSVQPLAAGKFIDVDGATATRLKRGDYPVHVRLDLHGMNRAEAYTALRGTIENAYSHGKRCVLVITGKGRAEGAGILKSHLPHWLNDPALRPLVLALGEAAPRHGGAGAYYVLVRRKREGAQHD